MGQPWALPVLNQEPLEKAIQLWLALGCKVQPISQFDRKSYFYPDLPMGYQITQFSKPTNIDGSVTFFIDKEFSEERTVGIVDAHIETDTGKSSHSTGSVTLDYNRAGTPLVEIVTQPDFSTTDEVIWFLKHIQRVARFQDVWDGDMDKGQMRVDVNISLKPTWSDTLGTRTETKNMSSFSAISRAIEYEVGRQTEVLNGGGEISQETRWWDDVAGSSFVMRSKEDAMDYRYFPEPDMPLVSISEQQLSKISQIMKPWPYERITRYKNNYKFNKEYINALINDTQMNAAFEAAVKEWNKPAEVAKRLVW